MPQVDQSAFSVNELCKFVKLTFISRLRLCGPSGCGSSVTRPLMLCPLLPVLEPNALRWLNVHLQFHTVNRRFVHNRAEYRVFLSAAGLVRACHCTWSRLFTGGPVRMAD